MDRLPHEILTLIVDHLDRPIDKWAISRTSWQFDHALARTGTRIRVRRHPNCNSPTGSIGWAELQVCRVLTSKSCAGGIKCFEIARHVLQPRDVLRKRIISRLYVASLKTRDQTRTTRQTRRTRRTVPPWSRTSRHALETGNTIVKWLEPQATLLRAGMLDVEILLDMASLIDASVYGDECWVDIKTCIMTFKTVRYETLECTDVLTKKVRATFTPAPTASIHDSPLKRFNAMRKRWSAERSASEELSMSCFMNGQMPKHSHGCPSPTPIAAGESLSTGWSLSTGAMGWCRWAGGTAVVTN